MSLVLEIVLLVVVAIAVVLLSVDLGRERLRQRRERADLARMRGDDEAPQEELPARPGRFERRLLAAGFHGPLSLFLLAFLVFGALVFVGIWLTLPRLPVAALLIALLAMYITWMVVVEWGRLRGRRFESQLVDAVDHMASAVTAGENPTQALTSAGAACEGAVRVELEAAVNRLDMGMNIWQALARMAERYDSEGTRIFTQALATKWSAGGDMAPVLRTIARVMRERIRLHLRRRAELTGAQVTALALGIVPYLLIPYIAWLRPVWIQTLTLHPLGPTLVVGAIALQIVGLLWLRRIVRIEL